MNTARWLALALLLSGCSDRQSREAPGAEQPAVSPTVAPAVDSSGASTAADTLAIVTDTTDPIPPGRLVTPWAHRVDSINAGKSWFVLRDRQGVIELIPTRLELQVTPGACEEPGVGGKPAAINGAWIVMMADVTGLRPGAIDTASVMQGDLAPPKVHDDSVAYSFRGERSVIRSERVNESGFRLVHVGKGGRLVLFTADDQDEGSWKLAWAGDLNRDGAPDLLLEATRKYSVRSWQLHMSGSLPTDGRWWPAAVYNQPGC